MSSGKIAQVIGPVVDVMFAAGEKLPEINNALVVYKNDERKTKIVLEVALELGDGMIRTIAMESTDGLTRGLEVLDTGRPISVPVGKETLGRVFNVLGDTIDLEAPFGEDAHGLVLRLVEPLEVRAVVAHAPALLLYGTGISASAVV